MEKLKGPVDRVAKQLTSGQNVGSESGRKAPASRLEVLQRAADVWKSMRLIYGTRFTSTYGEEPNPAWVEKIADLTDEECAAGCRRLRDSADDWPPSLPGFVNACRPRDAGVRYLGVPLTDEQKRALALPRPPVDPEKIKRHLANMRKNLGVEQ